MKKMLRVYLFTLFGFWITSQIMTGSIHISGGWQWYLLAAAVLGLLNIFLKPILKLIFLPLNAITLGLFTLVINGIVFYVFLKLLPAVEVNAWSFPGVNSFGVVIPSIHFPFWLTIIVAACIISFISNFLAYLAD